MGPDCLVTLPGFRYTIHAIFYSFFLSFQSSYAQNSTNRNYRLVKLIYELCARKHSITISYQTLHHTSQASNSESTHIVEARRNWLCHGTHGVKHVSVKFVVGIFLALCFITFLLVLVWHISNELYEILGFFFVCVRVLSTFFFPVVYLVKSLYGGLCWFMSLTIYADVWWLSQWLASLQQWNSILLCS